MNDNKQQLIPGTIALMIVFSFCAFAIYVGLRPLPSANQHYLDIALGALVAQFANISAYFFGSSKSAERAHATIEQSATPAIVQPPAAEVTVETGNAATNQERKVQ